MSVKLENKLSAVATVKKLLLSIEKRNNAITGCCPGLIDGEDDETARLRRLAEAQEEVDDAVKLLRDTTEGRFKNYSDAELILATHLWAGVWSSEGITRIDSNDLDRIIGRNNIEELGELIKTLLAGTSPVFSYAMLQWANSGRNCGYYNITICNPNRLHRLVLGDISIE